MNIAALRVYRGLGYEILAASHVFQIDVYGVLARSNCDNIDK
jgi:hypothetical protein